MSTITQDKPKAKEQAKKNVQPKAWLKGGSFLAQEGKADQIFVSEELNEEQQMIGEMIEDFCVTEIHEPMFKRGRELQVTNEDDKQEVLKLLKKSAELGLCGVGIPEEYGGLDLDFKTNVLFAEKIALGFSFATTIGAQTSIGSLPIVFYGTDEQKAKYLPGIGTGELIAAYALTEPNAGSDANSGQTQAKLSADGSHYLLTGQKIWITNGGFADVYIVFAKIEDDKNLSAFIVERNYAGFEVGQEEKKMGIKGSSTVQLFFEDCPVPVENLLGKRNEGFKIALNILNNGRIKAGSGGVGGSKFSLTKALEYATERRQFEQPISDFGAIQYKIGDICMKTFCIDAAMYRTAHMIDLKTEEFISQGLSASEAKVKAMREFAIEASIIKVKGSDLVCYATDETIQVYGGMGYAVETGIEMGYRDARITKIYEGTNEVNRLLIVGELGKRALQTKEIDLKAAGKRIPSFILQTFNPLAFSGPYAHEKRMIQAMRNSFLMIFGAIGKKLGKKVIDEQEMILQLSDVLSDVYIAESALLKVQKLEKMEGHDKEKWAIQKQMMELYLYHAVEHTRNAAREVIDSFETGFQASTLMYFVNRMLSKSRINPKETRRSIAQYVIEKKKYCF